MRGLFVFIVVSPFLVLSVVGFMYLFYTETDRGMVDSCDMIMEMEDGFYCLAKMKSENEDIKVWRNSEY